MASLVSASQIYTGFWIDWSKGAIAGSTITLGARTGSVLTAFLAFFVTIIGACLWRIVCFAAHQCFSTPDARDGIFHQHQLILRNTASAAAAGRAFAENAWSWRKTGMKSWSRSLPLAAFATLFMVAFGIASLLTSMVTKSAGSSRLIVSDHCGFFAMNNTGLDSFNAMGTKDLADTIAASIYARTCYGNSTEAHGLQCNLFTKNDLNVRNQHQRCLLDTGRMSSQTEFGINTAKSGRVDFRKVTTCAPLRQDRYVQRTVSNGKDGIGVVNDTIRHLQYGGWSQVAGMENDTWVYNQHALVDNIGYQFEALQYRAGNDKDAWQPIPALRSANADTTIMFLAPNAIQFTKPNSDPFFHANYIVPLTILGEDMTYWLSDNWVNVMACTDQYQFCNPLLPSSSAQCSPFTGFYGVTDALTNLNLNSYQQLTAQIIAYNLRATSVYYSIYNRGSGALRAQETVSLLAQSPLPNNQWHLEVLSWFDIALAKLQRNIMSYAAGPEHVTHGAYIQPPLSDIAKSMCRAQKVATTSDTVSFSVLGVAVILVVGVLVTGLWLTLETLTAYLQRKFKWGDYRRVRWIMDDKMQLQRMAFEEAGMGDWSKLSSNVPVTETGQVFGGLGHVDPELPRLGERWAAGGLAVAAVVKNSTAGTVEVRPDGRSVGVVDSKEKTRASVYERPVYQAVTPPRSTYRNDSSSNNSR